MRNKLFVSVRIFSVFALASGIFILARQMIGLCNAASSVALSVAQGVSNPLAGPHAISQKELAQIHAAEQRMNLLANNLANAKTIGFKRTLVEQLPGLERGDYLLDMNEGGLEVTSNPLDIAIMGEGFLRVKVSSNQGDGTAYTRAGILTFNRLGDLIVNLGPGYELIPPICVPSGATDISISADGIVQYTPKGETKRAEVGVIQLCAFMAPQRLLVGNGVFFESAASGPALIGTPGANGTGTLQSGFLEQSNVDPVHEWAQMVSVQQLLQLDRKADQLLDQTRQAVATLEKD